MAREPEADIKIAYFSYAPRKPGSVRAMRTVADAMIVPPVTVAPDATVQRASAAMLDASAHTAVVVEDGDRVVGIVTAEGIAQALADGRDATETRIGLIVDLDPPVFDPDDTLADAHQRMRFANHSTAPVVGSDGRLVGLLIDPEA